MLLWYYLRDVSFSIFSTFYMPPHKPAHTAIHTHAWNNSPWQQGSVAFMHTNLSYHSNYLEPDSFQSTNPPPSPFSYWLNEAATWSSRKAKSTPFDFMVALPSLCCRRPPSHRHTEVVSEHVTSFRSLSPNNPCDYQLTGAATGGIINLPHMFAVPPCLFVILIRLRIETILDLLPAWPPTHPHYTVRVFAECAFVSPQVTVLTAQTESFISSHVIWSPNSVWLRC